MTKYKWSVLGLIISAILFLVFLINPLIEFSNLSNKTKFIPAEPIPEEIQAELYKNAMNVVNRLEEANIDVNYFKELEVEKLLSEDYQEWYKNVPKKFVWSTLSGIGKSFYHWNLFWIPIIVFSFMAVNYKKTK